mgnify:CR=1 FL=1
MSTRLRLAYIAGKYQGKTHDWRSYREIDAYIHLARDAAIEVWQNGHAAFCPHMNTEHFEIFTSDVPIGNWYEGDLRILNICDAVILLSNWRESRGAVMEKKYAESKGIPVFESVGAFLTWAARAPKLGELDSIK